MADDKRRQFGRLKQKPSGRWQAGYVGPDNKVHYAPNTFERKDDAIGWLNAERRLLEDPLTWMPPKERAAAARLALPPTLQEYATGWLVGRDLKPRTLALYERLLDKLVYPGLGRVRLDLITPTAVRSWHTSLGPNTPTQRAHAYSLLKAILSTAVREEVILKNPCVLERATVAKKVHKTVPATLEELAIIAQHMPERLRLAVVIAAWLGLRQGEVTELRRKDIDLDEGVVRVRRAVGWIKGVGPVVGPPKSDAGVRDVSIPPHLLPVFREHLDEHTGFGREALLFPGRDSGEQLRPSTLYRWFYPARKAAGREDLRWHDLRHTGATLAAATGATLSDLMARLGHSTTRAAMIYQHASRDGDRAIAEALSRMAQPASLDAARSKRARAVGE